MGILNAGSGTGGTRATAQRLELAAGLVGFFTVMALLQTVVLELRGENALFSAALLAVLVATLWWLVRKRLSLRLDR